MEVIMNKDILKDLIQKSGLSQREFADKIGTTEMQISKWLAGSRNIKLQRLQDIAKKMGFTIKINYEILTQ